LILVTLGTINFPFPRMTDWLRVLLEQKVISESVLYQHGATSSDSLNNPLVQKLPMISKEQMQQSIRESRLIISHAGQGSTKMLLESGKSFIIVPRLQRFKEHIDDHQLDFSRAMQRLGIPYAETLEALTTFLNNPPPAPGTSFQVPRLVDYLREKYPGQRQPE